MTHPLAPGADKSDTETVCLRMPAGSGLSHPASTASTTQLVVVMRAKMTDD
jgi:hypothetical protein